MTYQISLAAAGTLCFCPAAHAFILVGAGDSTSQLLIEAPAFGTLDYRVSYDFQPDTGQDAFFLLSVIISNDSRLTADPVISGGAGGTENYFVSSFTFDGATQTTPSDFSQFFNHYVSGGEAGFPADAVAPVPFNQWTSGSGVSGPFREVAPNSSDALIFGTFGTQPSSAPVPEPSSALFLLAASTAFARRR